MFELKLPKGSQWSTAAALLLVSGSSVIAWGQAQAPGPGQPSTAKGDWPVYFADPQATRYSPLDQIKASNFNQLTEAWHIKTDSFGPRPEYKLEGTPLEVNGTIYTTAGSRRDVIALNAKTGELKWVYSLDEGDRAKASLASFLDVASPIGPTVRAMIASFTSPPATVSWS
jgi:glucose dehydrogenase